MELSPEAKSLYEMLMAETTEEYESLFMAHKKKILDAVRIKASSTTSSSAPLPVPRDTAPIANPTVTAASPAVLSVGNSTSPPHHRVPAAAETAPSTTRSTPPLCVPSGANSLSATSPAGAPTRDGLSPEARRIYDYLVGGSTTPATSTTTDGGTSESGCLGSTSASVMAMPATRATNPSSAIPTTCSTVYHVSIVSQAPMVLDVAPVAVNRDTSHLAAPTLSSCSTICLAGDPSATMTPWYQTVVPTSPKSTGSVSERCCFGPEPATAISTPTSALDLLEGGASISSLTPATYLLEDVDISMFSENMLPPWHPPWSTCIQNLHQLGGHDMPPLLPLLVESVECIRGRIEIRFCHFSSQVAEMFLFCCAACSIPNLHYMMDPKQISRDWLFSTTMELQWNANLAAINFTLGVQSVQLQPILSNWSVTFSDMMLAVASIVAGLLDTSLITQVTTQNGSGAYLKPVLCLIINLFSWSPHYKWPPMSLNGPFLISVDVQQEFMGMYSVTAVLSWLCIFVSARCSTVLLLPWDPGVLMDGMCANFHGFVIERTQPRLCAMKSPWPPPSSSRSTFYRTLNLHRTLDNMQLWVDCQVLKTWELQWSSVLIVIASAPRVKAQLKPTVFKWSNPFCLDKQFLSECTLDFLLARRTASIVWNYCCLDNLQCYLGSTNWALQEEQQPVLLQMSWQSFRYHWKAAYPMKPCSAIEGMFVKISTDQPRQDLHGSDEKSILHFTSFYDNNQLHVLVALGTFRCEFFSLGNTWDCLHYEYLQQWRPPDQTTEFLSVQHQWGCHAETACLRFTGRYLHGASEHLVSTLLLEFRCQSSQEYCDSARAVTRGQIVHSIAHNYSEEFAVVIYTTHNGMELIIGWESRSIGCSSWTEDFLPTRILELYNILSRLKVSQYFCSQVCEWQIPWWESSMTRAKLESGHDVPIFWWLHFAIQSSLGYQDEYSSSFPIGASLDLLEMGIYSRSTHYTEVHILDAIFLWLSTPILHAGKLYWLLGLHSSWDQFITESATYSDSQYFELQIPGYNCACYAISGSSRLRVGIKVEAQTHYDGHHINIFMSRIPVRHNYCMNLVQAHLELIYDINHCYYHDPARPPSKALQLPWDLGDSFAFAWCQVNSIRVDEDYSCPDIDTSQLPWDPGGSTRDRLVGKPNFKEGGLSTTCSIPSLGWTLGCHCWAWAVSKGTTNTRKRPRTTRLGNRTAERMASA